MHEGLRWAPAMRHAQKVGGGTEGSQGGEHGVQHSGWCIAHHRALTQPTRSNITTCSSWTHCYLSATHAAAGQYTHAFGRPSTCCWPARGKAPIGDTRTLCGADTRVS